MRETIKVSTWGRRGLGTITVRVEEGESRREAAARSIARRTGLTVATCQSQGTAMVGNKAESHHFQMTLGRHQRTGGYSVEGEIWMAIPAGEADPR